MGKSYGRFQAFGGMMVGALFFVLLVVGGVFMIKYAQRYSASVQGRVKKVECTTTKDSKGRAHTSCVADVEYTPKGETKPRTTSLNVFMGEAVGDVKTVKYDPRNPSDTMNVTYNTMMFPGGICMIACGFCICIGSVATFIAVMQSGTLAMGYGVASALRG